MVEPKGEERLTIDQSGPVGAYADLGGRVPDELRRRLTQDALASQE